MKSIYSFIVPEYYPNFKCKTSECRHPCCEGYEHIIVNHMFYEDFPYSKKHENIRGSFVSLAAVYSFLRFNAIGYCIKDPTREAFVDIAAALFRLIEHSKFDNNAVIILGKLNYIQPEKLTNLIFI